MEKETLKLNLKMLTPLWTGGINRKFDDFHETGIIGSLRWWYESIIRGLSERACNPVEKACKFDKKKFNELIKLPITKRLKKAGLCHACQLFGTTGWKRRFTLRVLTKLSDNIKPEDGNEYKLPKDYMGDVSISITGDKEALVKIRALFCFLEKFGGIGAKQQRGYGLFNINKVINSKGEEVKLCDYIESNPFDSIKKELNNKKSKFLTYKPLPSFNLASALKMKEKDLKRYFIEGDSASPKTPAPRFQKRGET